MLYVKKDEENLFSDMQEELDLKGELVESGSFHCTIRYVKTDKSPEKLLDYLKKHDLPTIKAKTTGFALYGKEKETLVVELDSKELHEYFEKINKFLLENDYPKSDFDSFKPHISLTELKNMDKPEWKKDYEKEITFSLHIVTNTDYEEIFRKSSK